MNPSKLHQSGGLTMDETIIDYQGDRSNRESLRMRLYVEVYIRSTNLSQKLPDVEAKSAVENFDKHFPVNEPPKTVDASPIKA